MGVTDSDPIVIHSSIALLQERFKQLHREKRRREERELLRLLSDSPASLGAIHSTRHYIDHTSKRRRIYHTEFLLTDKQAPKVSLSLWPSSSTDCQTKLLDIEVPVKKNLQTEDRLALHDLSCLLGSFDTDVDTSLHL
uniref:Uncharacterized protein n=1 Tax=Kalanchoe fedtschenkoi TaxID=63787 RepID=A0A7N0UPL5_KALFE